MLLFLIGFSKERKRASQQKTGKRGEDLVLTLRSSLGKRLLVVKFCRISIQGNWEGPFKFS
jgi:hypothetical protein